MRRFAGRRAIFLRVMAVWLITAATLVLLGALLSGVQVTELRVGAHRGRPDRPLQRARLAACNEARASIHGADARPRRARAQRRRDPGWSRRSSRAWRSTDCWAASSWSIGLTVVNTLVTSLLGIDDDDFYYRNVIKRQARRGGAGRRRRTCPGCYFLEIDGLAHDVLPRAIRDGNAPTLARWLREGVAPADRVGDRLVLADRRLPGGAAARLQRRHAGVSLVGEGPRRRDRHQPSEGRGGDRAARIERARPAARRRRQPREHPLRRRAAQPADDEHGAEARPPGPDRPGLLRLLREPLQRHAHVRAGRSARSSASAGARRSSAAATSARAFTAAVTYALVRAWATVIQRDLQVQAVIADIYAGRPVAYTTFLAYDEVAHHSGVERPDALATLRQVDRQFARIDARRQGRPRPTVSSSSPTTASRRARRS